MKKYQQGDVVMFQVDEETYNKQINKFGTPSQSTTYKGNTNTRAILAFGEVTGHTHRVNMDEMLENAEVTLNMDHNRKAGTDVPIGFQVHNEVVTLKHEEHNPLDLPPGFYLVRIVQEFNHITRRAQNVAD